MEITYQDIVNVRAEIRQAKKDLGRKIRKDLNSAQRSIQSAWEWKEGTIKRTLVSLDSRLSDVEDDVREIWRDTQ